ncbi:hypothetical protein SJY89_20180 [Bacillus velezensis]|uniref:hypothetical protein n=1 Tax=Bacillus TaxID=1386 RepID=UPI0006533F5B|nr:MULTISPECIES: hypothetical protein [Bacillus]APA05075.1 hypothetical protein BK055_21120 [Bacillus velezensis]KMN56390.1 hypothetical protein VK94_08270 [Bacillus sp. LK7]MCW5196289.1 hypothetical protein [Bacillus amyloliquefaciens]MDU0078245.1 hypothetical protein [Bacillus sp. IG2]MDU0103945.1 hypothetical protein [Bacillus sp. IS1]
MRITVDKQTKKFYLAFAANERNAKQGRWVSAVGHEIHVGKHRFSATVFDPDEIVISEVTSGIRVMNIPITQEIRRMIETKENVLTYLKHVGETSLTRIIEKHDFDKAVADGKRMSYNMLGEMPPIEAFNMESAE